MKKWIAVFTALVLMVSFCVTAQAASFQVTSDPAALSEGGLVNAAVVIYNDSSTVMQNIGISGQGVNYTSSDSIAPGSSMTLRLSNLAVGTDQLGQEMIFLVSWVQDGMQRTQQAVLVVQRGEPAEPLTAVCTPSKTSATTGDQVKLTYALTNHSAYPITDVTVKDNIAPDTAIAEGQVIQPGQTVKYEYKFTMGTEDARSAATINYTLNGSKQTLKLEDIKILYAQVSMDVVVTPETPTEEGTLFLINLTNTGNQTIKNVLITDENGAKVNQDGFTLEAGGIRSCSYMVDTDELRYVSFTIKGVDALGNAFETQTAEYAARPYVDPQLVSLSMVSRITRPMSDSGKLTVEFTVQNDSQVEITDAVIMETSLGELVQIGTLSSGTVTVEKEIVLSGAQQLEFILSAHDPSGAPHTAVCKMDVDYAKNSVTEQQTPNAPQQGGESSFTEAKVENISDTLFTILIVLVIVMVLCGVALVVLTIMERKIRRKRQEEDREREEARRRVQNRRTMGADRELQWPEQTRGVKPAHRSQQPQYRQEFQQARPQAPQQAAPQQTQQHQMPRQSVSQPQPKQQVRDVPLFDGSQDTTQRNAVRRQIRHVTPQDQDDE